MNTASTFLELTPATDTVRVEFDGQPLDLPLGANLAAALLLAGVQTLRQTPVSGAPRGAFCMMGACFDCLVDIDGVTRQACMQQVREGLVIRRVAIKGHADAG
ncbi:2Fe-2S iron-sulfur cluster-binding protein [Rhodobacteraceae bacterium KMM 6894]|nr:2Fe-2S iron-sulfur cluster-binding protein [Rhodobacteraceae bacterium KMM 6894]